MYLDRNTNIITESRPEPKETVVDMIKAFQKQKKYKFPFAVNKEFIEVDDDALDETQKQEVKTFLKTIQNA